MHAASLLRRTSGVRRRPFQRGARATEAEPPAISTATVSMPPGTRAGLPIVHTAPPDGHRVTADTVAARPQSGPMTASAVPKTTSCPAHQQISNKKAAKTSHSLSTPAAVTAASYAGSATATASGPATPKGPASRARSPPADLRRCSMCFHAYRQSGARDRSTVPPRWHLPQRSVRPSTAAANWSTSPTFPTSAAKRCVVRPNTSAQHATQRDGLPPRIRAPHRAAVQL